MCPWTRMSPPEKLKRKLLTPKKRIRKLLTPTRTETDGHGLHYMPFSPMFEWRGHKKSGPDKFKSHEELSRNSLRKFIRINPGPLVHLLFVIIFKNVGGAGTFSRYFTINMSPQCRAFTRTLAIEKLKVPLHPGPVEVGVLNDWCIIGHELVQCYFPIDCLQ